MNAKEILSRDGFKIEKDTNNNRYVLKITKINPAIHSGILTIKAKNTVGITQKQVILNIVGKLKFYRKKITSFNWNCLLKLKDPPKVLVHPKNVFMNEGKYAEFSCKFIANPLASSVTWFRNEKEEIIENDQFLVISILGLAESESILRIMKPTATDNGSSYLVRVKNEYGEAASTKGILNITSGAVFVVEPHDKSVLKEKEARIECIIKGNPRPTITWYFNDTQISEQRKEYRFEVDKGKDKYTLVVPKVLPAQCGTYKVKAVNEYASTEKTAKLTITELPKILTELEPITINENDPVKFSLKVSGTDRPPYKWYKDDIEVKLDDGTQVTEKDDEITLSIKSCSSKMTGNYSLKFKSDFGEVESAKCLLNINSNEF